MKGVKLSEKKTQTPGRYLVTILFLGQANYRIYNGPFVNDLKDKKQKLW